MFPMSIEPVRAQLFKVLRSLQSDFLGLFEK